MPLALNLSIVHLRRRTLNPTLHLNDVYDSLTWILYSYSDLPV
jgi:hypothetical protein